jgi:hypothetical protein
MPTVFTDRNMADKSIAEWLKELSPEDEKEALETMIRLLPREVFMVRINIRCASMFQALNAMFIWKESGNESKWVHLAAEYSNKSK